MQEMDLKAASQASQVPCSQPLWKRLLSPDLCPWNSLTFFLFWPFFSSFPSAKLFGVLHCSAMQCEFPGQITSFCIEFTALGWKLSPSIARIRFCFSTSSTTLVDPHFAGVALPVMACSRRLDWNCDWHHK